MNSSARAVRTSIRVPYATFEQTMKILALSGPELSAKLGYSDHAYNDWKNSGQMPKVAQLACEGLCAGKPLDKEKIFLVRSGHKSSELKLILQALSLEFVEL